MKVMNTTTIYDNSKALLADLYQERVTQEPQRAILELKLYHLPPYYDLDLRIRNGVALRPEVDLFKESETTVFNKSQCQSCFQTKPLYGEQTVMCLECWSLSIHALWKDFPIRVSNWTQIMNCTNYIPDSFKYIAQEAWAKTIEATTIKELLQVARTAIRFYPFTSKKSVECWTSPKKSLLVQEVGCLGCGHTPDFREVGWLWSADFSDWTNGYCPLCVDLTPATQQIWGMNEQQYRQWQDSYSQVHKMQRTVARYGALSLLLISPSANWANYITKIVPHATAQAVRLTGTEVHARPLANIHQTKAKSLSDLNLDLEDILSSTPVPTPPDAPDGINRPWRK